jgi:hypothetical protein
VVWAGGMVAGPFRGITFTCRRNESTDCLNVANHLARFSNGPIKSVRPLAWPMRSSCLHRATLLGGFPGGRPGKTHRLAQRYAYG